MYKQFIQIDKKILNANRKTQKHFISETTIWLTKTHKVVHSHYNKKYIN